MPRGHLASEWAANTAISNYDVDPNKVRVIPFGANISCNRHRKDIDTILEQKDMGTCKLLFVGVDWVRKGGDAAFAVADMLNRRGMKTELHIVGCNPSADLPDFVIRHGFISKKTEEGRILFDRLMSESHFLIVPTRAEYYGLVFAEASSFGLPSLTSNVGGIPSVVNDGKNGQTFMLDAHPEEYCKYIEKYMSTNQDYRELAISSYKEYEDRLNWSSASKKVSDLIEELCGFGH